VITYDHRSTGDTPDTDDDYSTRLFAADALALLEELGHESADVIGHSMGGRVAQWMALDRPAAVRRLVLASSGPGRFLRSQSTVTGVPVKQALGLIEKGYERYLDGHIRATFFTPAAAASPEADWLVKTHWAHRPSVEGYLKHIAARQAHRTTHLLSRINQPVLVVVGDTDTHPGGTGSHVDQSRHLARHLPAADYLELAGVSHGYFWEALPATASAILAWLRKER
jgi:pimeloyl-ACP methyl ester carboxylesterase